MEHTLLNRVKNTRVEIRRTVIEKILHDFDQEIMHLSKEQRLAKYSKMSESAFRFFRGSAYLYYFDVTRIPSAYHTPERQPIWIQGDLHMDNFGAFQNERGQIVYDVNDFDEGYMGSYLYDVLRLCISIGLYCEEQGIGEDLQVQCMTAYLEGYVEQLRRFKKGKDDPFTLIFTRKNTPSALKKVLKKLERLQRDHFVQGITEVDEQGHTVFAWSDELVPLSQEEREQIEPAVLTQLNQLDVFNGEVTIRDIAVKHGSGTASIGLKRYYLLIPTKQDAGGVDDLVLEMKEVRTAIPAYFLPYNETFWSYYEHQGERVVGTQHAMHHLEDPYLCALTIDGHEFYVRERSPYKKKIKPKNLKTMQDYMETVEVMGKITAKIHARADLDYSPIFTYHSEDVILETIGHDEDGFIAHVIANALSYKKTVYSDYELFIELLYELRNDGK